MEKKPGKKIWLLILTLALVALLAGGLIYFFTGRNAAEIRSPGEAISSPGASDPDSPSASGPGGNGASGPGGNGASGPGGNGASGPGGNGGPGGGASLSAQNPENSGRETFSGDGSQPGGTPPPSSSQNPSSARALSPTGVASSGPYAGGSFPGPPPSGVTLSFLSPGAADEVYCAQVENSVMMNKVFFEMQKNSFSRTTA
ncbi:MAG: hypothetical protein JRF65_02950, partial [Deltaproteobacteria bacterium]|nr:hypothetical protein [Deltaproteobacteria bacterium]